MATMSLVDTIRELAKRNTGTGVVELDESEPYYQIWRSAWHTPEVVFGERGGFPVLNVQVPTHGLSGILVRPEYVRAYEDIRSAYTDVALGVEVRRFRTNAGPDDKMGLYSPDLHPAHHQCKNAVIIAGQPGIGKTIFLWYTLIRRLIIHEPVFFQHSPNSFFIFHESGVTQIFRPEGFLTYGAAQRMIPFRAWCLIDSNPSMIDPVPFAVDLCRFVVQAAFPNALRRDWCFKAGITPSQYVMKPMPVGEIELVRHFRPGPPQSIENIRIFHKLYGPSARGALFPLLEWEKGLDVALQSLGDSTALLVKMAQDLTTVSDRHPDISPKLLLLEPGEYRHECHVDVITQHVWGLLLEWVESKFASQVAGLHATFNQLPGTKSLARRIFEHRVHGMLVAGGVYPLVELTQHGNSKTWSQCSKRSSQLALPSTGTTGTFQIQQVINPPTSRRIIPPTRYSDPVPLRDHTYFWPISPQQATFDSFVYDGASNTIVAFQITVAPAHSVVPLGLKWLKDLRKNRPPKIILVGISMNDRLELTCEEEAHKLVDKFYHLKLEHFPERA